MLLGSNRIQRCYITLIIITTTTTTTTTTTSIITTTKGDTVIDYVIVDDDDDVETLASTCDRAAKRSRIESSMVQEAAQSKPEKKCIYCTGTGIF